MRIVKDVGTVAKLRAELSDFICTPIDPQDLGFCVIDLIFHRTEISVMAKHFKVSDYEMVDILENVVLAAGVNIKTENHMDDLINGNIRYVSKMGNYSSSFGKTKVSFMYEISIAIVEGAAVIDKMDVF